MWAAFHQAGAPADRDGFAALVDPLMLELDDPGVLARLAAPFRLHDRSRPQRVAVKDRLRKPDIAHPEIGDRRPERRFADADADDQTEGEQAVDEALAELGLLGEFFVEMQRLRVHRQRAEQHIVHFGDGAADRVFEDLTLFKLLEIQPGHPSISLPNRRIRGRAGIRSTGNAEKHSMRRAGSASRGALQPRPGAIGQGRNGSGMDISQLIADNGACFYLIAFIWTFLEGETFVLFAAFAAAQGLLNPALLFSATWLGSFSGDQTYFWIGRYFGLRLLNRFPKWRYGVESALYWLERYNTGFILSFRFIYGDTKFLLLCDGAERGSLEAVFDTELSRRRSVGRELCRRSAISSDTHSAPCSATWCARSASSC